MADAVPARVRDGDQRVAVADEVRHPLFAVLGRPTLIAEGVALPGVFSEQGGARRRHTGHVVRSRHPPVTSLIGSG